MYKELKQILDKENLLTESEWNIMEEHLVEKNFNKDEIITKEGSIESYLYFIKSGAIRKYYLVQGKEHCIDFRFENQFVSSYTSFLTQTPSRQNVQALEDSVLVCLSYSSLQQLYDNSKTGEKLGRHQSEYLLIEKETHEASLMLDSPDERYKQLLATKPNWLLRIPSYMIASYLNITPETFSRVKTRNA